MIPVDIAPQRLLAVAKSPAHIEPMVASLRAAGCRVEVATTRQEAIAQATAMNPDVIVIEDPLPGADTVELTMTLRNLATGNTSPTFIMSVGGESAEVHAAITGPTHVLPTSPTVDRLSRAGLCLDRLSHRAWADDRILQLTPTEFKLLWELMRRPGYVLNRTELTELCCASKLSVQTRTIDAHIKSIRRKLRDHAGRIETVHGIGYRFDERTT